MKKEYMTAFQECTNLYRELKRFFSTIDFGQHHDNYFNMIYSSEREYREAWIDQDFGCSLQEAVIYSYVYRLLEARISIVNIKNVIFLKPEIIWACSLYKNYSHELEIIFRKYDIKLIQTLSYRELVKK